MSATVIDLAEVRKARRKPKRQPVTFEEKVRRRERRLWTKLLRWIETDRDFLSATERAWFDQIAVGEFNLADMPRLRRLHRLAFIRRYRLPQGRSSL